MKNFYVYKTTCKINGKIYIGKASSHKKNTEKYLGSGKLIQAAIKKYGRDNFEKEILGEYDKELEAYKAEQYFIEKYDSKNSKKGYNIHSGGCGYLEHLEHDKEFFKTTEYREKQRKASKDMWDNMTPERREWRKRLAKESWTPERRQARSEMLKRRLADPEAGARYRENLSKAVREANATTDVIERRKIACRKAMDDPEYRADVKDRMNQPWNIELNSKVRAPLAIITKKVKNGALTEEEAEIQRQQLYNLREEIHLKYKEQEEEYKRNHPPKWKERRKKKITNERNY